MIKVESMIKKTLKKVMNIFLLEFNSLYDYISFKRHHSNAKDIKNKKSLESWILQDKHRIEKGLSLPLPRLFFGEEVIKRLVSNLQTFANEFAKNEVYYFGVGCLVAYKKYHLENGGKLPEFFIKQTSKIPKVDFDDPNCELVGLGKLTISKQENKEVYKEFLSSRHSCRNFDSKQVVSPDVIKEIMSLSILSPSVCNRQHWYIHFYTGEKKNEILSFQNGNVGFTENIPYIAVITSDLRAFYTPDERNQAYVDGGLFSMNLMYAMQALGLSSCALNWCNSFISDIKFKKLNYVEKHQTVIMVLAFGYANKYGYYAKSPRLPVESFYNIDQVES